MEVSSWIIWSSVGHGHLSIRWPTEVYESHCATRPIGFCQHKLNNKVHHMVSNCIVYLDKDKGLILGITTGWTTDKNSSYKYQVKNIKLQNIANKQTV